ncbi:MAG TPA: secretin N-terminal domain-containing protein, partial [Vicinamibacterales bacterium]|nr:secretin N-terminal domain-containing protein [Vicinamibacterales bacterium]
MNAHTDTGIVHPAAGEGRGRGRRTLAQFAVLAALAAGGGALAAGSTPVRLVGVSSSGNAVLIEASEPVAYSVANPDPLTVVVDLRNVVVQDAQNRVSRGGAVAGVRFEQATASDGKALARVRLALAQPAGYTVRSARNTIRVELSPAPARGTSTIVLAPAPPDTAAANDPEPPITLEQAIANAAAITPPQEVPDAMAALKTVPSSASGGAAALRPEPPAARPAVIAPPRTRAAQPQPEKAPAVKPQPAPAASASTAIRQQPPTTPSQQITGVPDKKYQGHPISMDFQGVDLRSVLRTLAEISGLNMVIDPDVQGTVDIVLNEVPWDQALEVILRGNQLDYTVDGTIVRIAKIDTLKKEQEQRQQLTKAQAEAGTLAFQTFSLSYAKAAQVAPILTKSQLLSTRGQVQIDERTNTLIVADLSERFTGIRQLLQTLDRPEPQVEVEARVVQTTREFARAIGIQWGLNCRMTPDVGNTTNLAFPNRGTLGGRTGHINGPV